MSARIIALAAIGLMLIDPIQAQAAAALDAKIAAAAQAAMPQVIAWRRQIHTNPELSNAEVQTAALVAAELASLGMVVRTEIAHHGVIGVLKGARPGGVVAL